MQIFQELESEVRGYCRSWPTVFSSAKGSTLTDEGGRAYLDFFAGAGTLSYGHNPPAIKERLLSYLAADGVVHGLDTYTTAKRAFIERFDDVVLRPRGLRYKLQFPGPTGTNSVEAALKLARKVTGRERVVGFTNAFHGMTLGSLAVTGSSMKRQGAGVPLNNSMPMPFDGFLGPDVDTVSYVESFLAGDGSGLDLPAAIIIETVQAEGGINVARDEWLRALAELCLRYEILLIVDDIQVGCGRTGPFFSFERAGVTPDIICLSKAISGYGLPMALTLMRPELDVWDPGEHNGTFRGNNAAFVTATAALEQFWTDDVLTGEVDRKAAKVHDGLKGLLTEHGDLFAEVRGKGLLQGLLTQQPEMAGAVCAAAFERGLLVETSGPQSEVVKLLPPLVIDDSDLDRGLEILAESAQAVSRGPAVELVGSTNGQVGR
ncbi:MAG: diaminobutyrate--2-oxoglutarate transaminase [Acidimicrobiia bacterium]|nr:diaminobutyrate--2-oxoglutarate transaminase [Acidimicrobiia bacterium]